MQKSVKKILNLIMFFQLFAAGAFNPIQSLYFTQHLGFSGTKTGLILSIAVISTIFAPLIGAFIVDKLLSARRFLMVLHAAASIFAFVFSFQTNFVLVLISYFLFMIAQGPTVGLVNAITFANLPDPAKNFGSVRMYGTLGWMAAGWSFGLLTQLIANQSGNVGVSFSLLPWAFRIAALGSVITLLGTAILPGNPKRISHDKSVRSLIPKDALSVIRKSEIILLMILYFVSGIFDRFYVFGAGPYLSDIGFSESLISPILTIGQIAEVPALFFLGRFIASWGFRPVFTLGLFAQVIRFGIFCFTTHPVLVFFAVGLNSLVFGFFYAAATVFIDSHTTIESRSEVHQLINLVFLGLGSLVGNTVAGAMADAGGTLPRFDINFWIFPFIGSLVLLCVARLFFFPRILKEQTGIEKR